MRKPGSVRRAWAVGFAIMATAMAAPGHAQGRPQQLTQAQLDDLLHKHDGYYGALAPQNLKKRRPAAPIDLTGTWFIDLHEGFMKFMFGPPYPEFLPAAQKALAEGKAAMAAGKTYRDSIGQCFPPGMPMIMTRVWPISFIQLPTAVYMIAGFENSFRAIYLDGRKFSDPDTVVPTYNGESIGHWEGKTLVVQTKYFESHEHYIDLGIPTSDKFEMTERMQLVEDGKVLQIEYIMTDPDNWKGEWRSTKRWLRQDYSDIGEVECIEANNAHLPGTDLGESSAPPIAPKK